MLNSIAETLKVRKFLIFKSLDSSYLDPTQKKKTLNLVPAEKTTIKIGQSINFEHLKNPNKICKEDY